MKRYLRIQCELILLSLLSATSLEAQITITQADMPGVGTNAVMAVDTSGILLPQSGSASAQTWNFSTLANSQSYGYQFVAPSATPYYAAFPSSNLADSMIYGNGYTYISSTASSFSQTGFGEKLYGYSLAIASHPFFEQIALPATYGTTDGGVSKGDTAMAFTYALYDSAKGNIAVTYADTIDAFGVMTTPYGTDSVVRQKHYDITIDSGFVHSFAGWTLYRATSTINYQYRWYAKGINYYFAVMQMNAANTKDSVVQWYDGVNLGVNAISHSVYTKVYPNPCHSEITFNCSSGSARQVVIFDVTGRQFSTEEIKNGFLTINTSAYSAGMYFYQVQDDSGNILDRGKFIVQ